MMQSRSMIMNILIFVGLLFAGSIILNLMLGIVSTILWVAVKIMIPIAIIVWLVRVLSSPSKRRRNYY